jgi:MraZ protein
VIGKGKAHVFLSTTTNTLDAKGRVSVPALFRARIAKSDLQGVVVWRSFDGAYLEGAMIEHLEQLQDALDQLDYYDEARVALTQAIFADAEPLSFDSGGRVKLADRLIEYAQLDGKATFVGLGRTFQIWNPDHHASHLEAARETAMANRHKLASPKRPAP